jgi:hypothetical protein
MYFDKRRSGGRIHFDIDGVASSIGPGERAFNRSFDEWRGADDGRYEYGPPSGPREDRVITVNEQGEEIPRRVHSSSRRLIRARFPDK